MQDETKNRFLLVVVDETEELHQALHFACARAKSIDANIALVYVITPNDFAQDLGIEGGNWNHSEMSLDQIFNLRPTPSFSAYSAGPKGLYLCGSSSHPGGDIMGLSGRNGALRALRDTK